jgi:hypothetical protein
MAIVATLVMRDSFERHTRKRLETETDVLATAQAAVGGLLTDLGPCTDLTVEHVVFSFKDTGLTLAGEASSNVDQGATFRGRVGTGELASLKIPGFPLSKVGANGFIDLDDEDVAALLDNWEGAGAFTLSDGESISEWIEGELDK